MLYEVITGRAAGHEVRVVADFGVRVGQEAGEEALVTRITSYNVCYTKLLRTRSQAGEVHLPSQHLHAEMVDSCFGPSLPGGRAIGGDRNTAGHKRRKHRNGPTHGDLQAQ